MTPRDDGSYGKVMPQLEIPWQVVTDEMRRRFVQAAVTVLSFHRWVIAAYFFGSAARGDRPARDLDLGLLARPIPRAWPGELSLGGEIARLANLGIEVDVRLLNNASPVFLNRVLGEGRLIYETDRRARLAFEARSMSLWLDFRPAWERVRREVLQRWSHG